MKFLFIIAIIINVFITNLLIGISDLILNYNPMNSFSYEIVSLLKFYASPHFIVSIVICLIIIIFIGFMKFNNNKFFKKIFIIDIICYIQLILFCLYAGTLSKIGLFYATGIISIIAISSLLCYLIYKIMIKFFIKKMIIIS